MPELPEVEAARRLLARVAVGRRVAAVWCAEDTIVFEGAAPARFARVMRGRRIRAVHRHGKHLWLELDRPPALLLHFGMTGGIRVPGRRPLRLRSSGRRRSAETGWPPRFTKLRLRFDDGGEVAMLDARRLGRIRLRDDPRREPPLAGLGPDAWRELPPPAVLRARLSGRRGPIKALLLDQSFLAGVGNWVADEVLYQAAIAPRRAAGSLSAVEARRLHGALRSVLATAVRARAESERYPRRWLFHERWDRHTRIGGRALRHETIGGRTTAWVPGLQR
jgi:formamidopyrimidine-DNA glycosylase